MIKWRWIILTLLLLSLSAGTTVAETLQADNTPFVMRTASSGGNYQLTVENWSESVAARGGNYTVLSIESPELRGNGCCCVYLPYSLR